MSLVIRLENLLAHWWGRLLISAALVFLILAPYLLGFMVLVDDGTDQQIPQLAFYQRAFKSGENPFWNPNLAVGFPNFVTNGHPYNPLNAFLLIMGPIDAYYWSLFLLLTLALFLTITFLRELGISNAGSFIGGLAYLLGNIYFTLSVVGATPVFVQAAVFLAVLKLHKSASFKSSFLIVLFGGLVVGAGWLMPSGYFGNFYIFLAAVAFTVFLEFQKKSHYFRLPLLLTAIFVIGTLIGLLQIVPGYALSKFSGRAGGLDYQTMQGDTISPAELLNFVHLSTDGSSDAYLYMGIIPLLLLIFSFWTKNPLIIFFRWAFLLALASAIKYSPIFWLLNKIPLLNFFQGASRSMLVGIFAGAALAGFGLDWFSFFVKEKPEQIKKILGYLLLTISGFLVPAAIIYWLQIKHLLALISSAIFLLVFWAIARSKNLKPQFLALAAIADFLIAFYFFTQSWLLPHSPFMISRKIYMEDPPGAQFLREHPGRVLPVFPDDFDNAFYALARIVSDKDTVRAKVYDWQTLSPNTHLFHGVSSLEAYDPLMNVDAGRLMAILGAGRELRSLSVGEEEKLDKLNLNPYDRGKILKERSALADFLGIKYFISGFTVKKFGIDWPEVSVSPFYLFQTPRGAPVFSIVENPNAKPIIYFSTIDGYVKNRKMAYDGFKSSDFKKVFVECAECENKPLGISGTVNVRKQGNGLLMVDTSSPRERFLIFSQNYLPGWRAYIDGQEVKAYKVNTVFGGIFVPPGEHEVRFEYDYWSLFDPAFILRLRSLGPKSFKHS